jgi:DNA-binding CsgD family transcriptional regulator
VREDVPLAIPQLMPDQLAEGCRPAARQAGWIVAEPRWDAYYAVVFAACVAIVEAGKLDATGRIAGTAALAAMVPWYLFLGRPPRESLSAREAEILAHVARGRTNAQIGRALYISEATVKTHLLRAFGKLGVSGRTAAVTTAIERGLLPPPGANP